MKKLSIIATAVLFLISGCATNPFTGKKTMAFVSNSQIFPTAFAQYSQVLKESKVETNNADVQMINRVGQKISAAAEKILKERGFADQLKGYKWEYSLIDEDVVNAWCMPGGKIAFYRGILPIAQSETGVAIIMGHEVAHALANHGQQRMSAGYVQQIGALAGNLAINDPKALQAFNQYYGVGSNVLGMLPFSRKHESEADEIGLTLAAAAGYNPDEAAELWKRMKAKSGGQAPPEFFSTHPSNDTRIAELKRLAPIAKQQAAKYGVTSFKPIKKQEFKPATKSTKKSK